MRKIKSFADLIAWQKTHQFVLKIYKITKAFPKEEEYGLVDQMCRTAVSITSNIAEEFYRRTSADKANFFYYKSISSLVEIQNQLVIARDLGYIDNKVFKEIANDSIEAHKLINSLIKSSSTK